MRSNAYCLLMDWEVIVHDAVRIWLINVGRVEREGIDMAIQVLHAQGPVLGRPLVDHIKGSQIKNLKELRPLTTTIRILFAFDPERRAILLVAGDKGGSWRTWYKRAIAEAEERFSVHLSEMRQNEK